MGASAPAFRVARRYITPDCGDEVFCVRVDEDEEEAQIRCVDDVALGELPPQGLLLRGQQDIGELGPPEPSTAFEETRMVEAPPAEALESSSSPVVSDEHGRNVLTSETISASSGSQPERCLLDKEKLTRDRLSPTHWQT